MLQTELTVRECLEPLFFLRRDDLTVLVSGPDAVWIETTETSAGELIFQFTHTRPASVVLAQRLHWRPCRLSTMLSQVDVS